MNNRTDDLAIACKLSLEEEEKRKKKEEDEKRKAAQDRYLEERHAEEREKWPTDPQVAVAPPEKYSVMETAFTLLTISLGNSPQRNGENRLDKVG